VRELSNLIERAVLFCPGETLEAEQFPSDIRQGTDQSPYPSATTTAAQDDPQTVHISFRIGEQSLSDLEDRIIGEVLTRSEGNKTLAAKYLGITRWMLDRRRKPKA
jgi:two-component system response regulator AtoC